VHEDAVREKFSLSYSEQANKAYREKKFDSALNLYTKALKCQPLAKIYSNRAITFIKLKKYKEARKDAKMSVKIDPSNIKGYLHLAKSLILLGQYNKALEVIPKGLQLDLRSEEKDCFITLHRNSSDLLEEMGPLNINFLEVLPGELSDYIMQFLDVYSLMSCEQVCKCLFSLSRQDYLWQNHCTLKWKGKAKNKFTGTIITGENPKHWKLMYFDALRDSKRTTITEK
jgi:tetratricopeptide (TPR) repeat protein